MNFDMILLLAVISAGALTLLEVTLRPQKIKALVFLTTQGRSYFPVLFIVWCIRSFVFQLHYIPTGSLEPTVLPGDLIITNQFAYGLHFPVFNTPLLKVGVPHRGDLVVFRSPHDPEITLIKRVVGVPGDHIAYQKKVLIINGVHAKQSFLRQEVDSEPSGEITVNQKLEDLGGVTHAIFIRDHTPDIDFNVVVPEAHYFMMGDNRDNSADSRVFGFVSERELCGKASAVFVSWDKQARRVRLGRTLLEL